MKKLLGALLLSATLAIPGAFAQSSDGVLVSPPVQDEGSSQDSTTNTQSNSNSSGNSKPQPSNNNSAKTNPTVPATAGKNKQKGPSQAAIDACQDKFEGDPCEMTTSHGTRTGTCTTSTEDSSILFCKSNRRSRSSISQYNSLS